MKLAFRSRGGKTVVIYLDEGVKITGDFFCSEEELSVIEEELSLCRKPSSDILGVDMEELYEIVMSNYPPCVGRN